MKRKVFKAKRFTEDLVLYSVLAFGLIAFMIMETQNKKDEQNEVDDV